MQKILYPAQAEWAKLLERPDNGLEDLYDVAREVLDDVKQHGDEAVKKYTSKFDGVDLTDLQVSQAEIDEA